MNPLPFFEKFETSQKVLLAGAGGGFDLFCGLPLYFYLKRRGKEVFLANLTFSELSYVEGERLDPVLVEVTEHSNGSAYYFPEKYLCAWLTQKHEPVSIYCFERTGVVPLKRAYKKLVEHLSIDTLVLVDGGTDSLLRGDETGLGTPEEDVLSLLAGSSLEIEQKLLLCLGFGVDTFHGVCHAQFLRAVAELTRTDDFYGSFSLLKSMPDVREYIEACAYVFQAMPKHISIVNSSIISALDGDYGDTHRTERTAGSELWINPFMPMYWLFGLDAVAQRILYADKILDTEEFLEVSRGIEEFRRSLRDIRSWESIPS